MKLTTRQKLAKRKFQSPNKFVWHILAGFVMRFFMGRKFNVQYKWIDKVPKKGPFFLVFNHQSRLDYMWTVRLAYPRPLNFVVGYNEHFRSHLKFIFSLLHVIPKKNFTLDLLAMQGIRKVIKSGGAVAFSPEGMSSIYGQNQPVVNGTGKFFKHYAVPIYCVKTRGAYLSNNKICLDNRYGRIDASIELLFSTSDLEKLSPEEIDNKLNEAFRNDDYEWQKQEHIHWETNHRICTHLHDINYQCPKCGAEFSMVGEGNTIRCLKCGNGAKMNDYYEFEPFSQDAVIPESPSKWLLWERENIIKDIRKNPNYEFNLHTKVGEIPDDHYLKDMKTSEVVGEGDMKVDHQGIHFLGKKHGLPFKFDLSYEEVHTLVMVTDVSFFSLYVNDEYYDFFPDHPIVGKLLLLVEEMHRLHVNRWKNFPWFNYLYNTTK